jgi:3-hydroxyacyl-CoA dehydrogenase/3a,7a,12a-trihydroxy-5b-cholest-24-enoyl-CoA hydratase
MGEFIKLDGSSDMANRRIEIVHQSEMDFTGKVVLVTGSGRGLGRTYALDFAKRGANVVVNDFGGGHSGEGNSTSPADDVVNEINRLYGTGRAIANYDSVVDGDKIVECVISTFGKIDVVVNNAGIVRDVSFVRMTDKDWNLIYEVHLLGAYKVTKAAWPHMIKNNYGKIIMTSSSSGIYGNRGQANYSSAKAALIGFANSLAIEGAGRNIMVNTIAPIASSRILATVNTTDKFKPEFISPLVLWLCHQNCKETGGIFECGAGWYSKLRWIRTQGVQLREPIDPKDIEENWSKITDFTDPIQVKSAVDSMKHAASLISKL